MTENQEERMVLALEMMATALISIGKTYDLQYYKTYPPPRTPRDIQVTHPPTEEEKLRAAQGATGEATTAEWMNLDAEEEIGFYERRSIEAQKRERAARRSEENREPVDPAARESQSTGP